MIVITDCHDSAFPVSYPHRNSNTLQYNMGCMGTVTIFFLFLWLTIAELLQSCAHEFPYNYGRDFRIPQRFFMTSSRETSSIKHRVLESLILFCKSLYSIRFLFLFFLFFTF